MPPTTTRKYGDNFYSPQTGALQGQVKFDSITGAALQPGQVTTSPAFPVKNSNIPSIVPVNNLTSNPVNLMPTVPQTAAAGGLAAIGAQSTSVQDQFLQQQNALMQQQQTGLTQEKNGLADVYNRIFGQADRNEDIYKDLKVDEARKAVDNYSAQIQQEQLANRRQIDELNKNANGMTSQALAATTQEVNRKSLSAQADIAVLQGAAAANYDAVASAADRKIKAETESLQNELDARKFFYQENKEDYNRTDQRIYEQQNKKIEQEIKNKEEGQKIIVDGVANGAPASVIQQAQTLYNQGADPVEIQRVLGQYSSAALDRQVKLSSLETDKAQRANIYSQIADRNSQSNPNKLVTPPLINPQTGKTDPVAQLSSAINGSKLKNNADLQNIIGVIAGAQQLAEANPDGKFPGVRFELLGGLGRGPKGQQNAASLEAINLKVQQWASGAALTEQQTKQVEKLTPRVGDTAAQIRNKTNSLTNYMLSQAQSQFASQGYNLNLQPVNYFSEQQNGSKAGELQPGSTGKVSSGLSYTIK